MSKQATKALIDANITSNGVQAITGPILNNVLNTMVDDYGTQEEVSQLEAKVDDISTGKYYGYYATSADLPDDATVDGFAYVGSGPTYTIYNCESGVWTSSGITVNQSPVGNDEDIDQNEDGKLQFANRVYNAQQPNGMGYKILRKDATFASQVTDTNTIYEIRYPFNLGGADISLPSGCELRFNGGTITGGTLSGAIVNSELRPEWFGAKGDGITDDSAAFNMLVALVNGGSKGKIVLQKSLYLVKNQLHFKGDTTIIGNNATMKFEGDSTFACIKIAKDTPYTKLDAGTISADAFSNIITVGDADGIAAGDYLIIHDSTDYSWSAERAYYHAGDIVKVLSVNGNNITITETLMHGYSGASIELYKLDTIKAEVCDLTIIGSCEDGNTDKTLTPIYVMCGVDSSFKNLVLSGSNTTNFSLNLAYNVVIDNVKIDFNSANVSLNYGISIGSCKNIIIGNSIFKTYRHGIEIGGGEAMVIPNRYIEIHDCIVDGYSTVSCGLDSHGNAEFITFRDNLIMNGIDCCASRFLIEGNKIFSRKELGYSIFLVSAKYRTGIIRDNEIHWYDNANGDCGISIYTNNEADTDAVLEISGNRFFIDGQTDGVTGRRADVYFRNGTTYKYKELILKNNVFHKDGFQNCHSFYAKSSLADTLTFDGNIASNAVELDTTANIGESLFSGNIFKRDDASCLIIDGGGTKCEIIGNRFVTNNYPITFANTTQNENTIFVVSKNFFDITMMQGGRAAINSQKSKLTYFVGNIVFSATVQAGRYLYDIVAANSPEVVAKKNKFLVNDVRLYSPSTVTTMKRDSGDTASRNYSLPGDTYFDTTLGKTIVWDGTAWKNMDGTAL